MKLADEIAYKLISWVQKTGGDIVIPNYYHGIYEMDVFKLTSSGYIHEFEIKISKSDYMADFKKNDFKKELKHDKISQGKRSNKFFFVVPEGLLSKEDIPNHAGLILYTKYKTFKIIKPAPLLHKNLFTDYKSLATSLSYREMIWRRRLNYIRTVGKRSSNLPT